MFIPTQQREILSKEDLSLARTPNAQEMLRIAREFPESDQDLHKNESFLYDVQQELASKLVQQTLLNGGIAIDGIRGTGKSTLARRLDLEGCGNYQYHSLPTEIFRQILKPRGKGSNLLLGEGDCARIVTSLVWGAHHADRLASIEETSLNDKLIFDRYWPSFVGVEAGRLSFTQVEPSIMTGMLKSISRIYPDIDSLLILEGVSVRECEKRIVTQRGDSPRNTEDLAADGVFVATLDSIKNGDFGTLSTYPIHFLDARNQPERITQEALQYIEP